MDYTTEDFHLAAYPTRDDSEADLTIVAVSLIQATLTINDLLKHPVLAIAIADAHTHLGVAIDRPRLTKSL
ncbi:hypothetical protein [Lentzea cavernae]|nr:hypothetical protein [Lentzea cavernae]